MRIFANSHNSREIRIIRQFALFCAAFLLFGGFVFAHIASAQPPPPPPPPPVENGGPAPAPCGATYYYKCASDAVVHPGECILSSQCAYENCGAASGEDACVRGTTYSDSNCQTTCGAAGSGPSAYICPPGVKDPPPCCNVTASRPDAQARSLCDTACGASCVGITSGGCGSGGENCPGGGGSTPCTIGSTCPNGCTCFDAGGGVGQCPDFCTTVEEYTVEDGEDIEGNEPPKPKPCPPEYCPGAQGPGSGGLDLGILKPGNFSDFLGLLSCVFTYLVYFAIPIAVIVFGFAGIMFLTSRGDPGKRDTAKKILIWGVVGFAIVLLAKGILIAILSFFGSGSVTLQCDIFG